MAAGRPVRFGAGNGKRTHVRTEKPDGIDTEFYIPLHGDRGRLDELTCDIGFMVTLQESFKANNLVADRSIVTLRPAVMTTADWSIDDTARTMGRGRGDRHRIELLFLAGNRTKADDADDYFDHLDASLYVSACHSAMSPSRSRALDAWRKNVKSILAACNANHRFLTPGTRQTALRDGTILRVRHDLDQERRHKRVRLTKDAKVAVEMHEGYMLFFLTDGTTEIGPVPVTMAETGVGGEQFVRTIEAAAGEPVVRRAGRTGDASS